jgi:serine/threonine-protein kinase PRP4
MLFPDSVTNSPNKNPTQVEGEIDSSPFDMFGDDRDSSTEVKPHKGHIRKNVDSTDDKEGYYRPQLGEIMGNRYRIVGYFGKGVFSNVLKAKDLITDTDVAIKLLRNNDYMKKTGLGEVKILETLTVTDPERKYCTIKLITHFVERQHLCLVFEAMDINLRQLIKKLGKKTGLDLNDVRVIAFKILKALFHLKSNRIIHADLKPDNMLINQDRDDIKVADLGSAMLCDDIIETPILVSRYYRAPEIILGLKYDCALDMFSFGCCIYECATGETLLKSRDNNDHLRMLMEYSGMFPKKMLAKGKYTTEHFDESFSFLERRVDNITNKEIVIPKIIAKPSKSIHQELLDCFFPEEEREKELVRHLADLIERSIIPDPQKRLTPDEALLHPLFHAQYNIVLNNKE